MATSLLFRLGLIRAVGLWLVGGLLLSPKDNKNLFIWVCPLLPCPWRPSSLRAAGLVLWHPEDDSDHRARWHWRLARASRLHPSAAAWALRRRTRAKATNLQPRKHCADHESRSTPWEPTRKRTLPAGLSGNWMWPVAATRDRSIPIESLP